MSWKASAWAKEQRLGSPAAKSILLCLGDYAEPEKASCWPSQEQLAADAEVSERTARDWLQRLEEWGLIERQRRTGARGARANDLIMLKLDCKVLDGTERLRSGTLECEVLPAEIAGRTNRQPDADPTGNQDPPTGNQQPSYIEEPSNRTVQGTSQPGAQAREREATDDLEKETDDPKKIEAAFWRMVRVWPSQKGMPKEGGLRAFAALTPQERIDAERLFPHWLALLKAQRKDHVPAPSTYFGQKLFSEVPEPVEQKPTAIGAPPFGPVWGAVRARELLTPPAAAPPPSAFMAELMARDDDSGRQARLTRQATYGWPTVKRMHEGAENRRGITVAPELEALATLMEPVKVGSDLWTEWRAYHEQRGWPWLPDPGQMPVVYFPAGGPAGLEAFEQAVRGTNDAQQAAE
ncbi:helix-turn-helix domain-containing protein [Mesorhizobium sp. M0130]|uniref:helix-turn-helix domain-containing protein n=1 Tax=Mesorhizobium sp. M0130 TaxID=2956887 RepID=UPI0033371464